MNDKRMIRARLIRLPIFLGIVFLFAWMFRWELGNTVAGDGAVPRAGYVKLDRWTGTNYHCAFVVSTRVSLQTSLCTPLGEQQ